MSVAQEPLAVARQYWGRLQERTQGLAALFLRNPLDDFVPGISDLDLRLVTDGAPAGGWLELAEAVADVHRDMVATGREMWRLLEHPPGACVTLAEALDPRLFHPEMRQWQPCAGDEAAAQAVMEHIQGAPWSAQDDRFWRDRLTSLLSPWGPAEERINLPAGQFPRYRLHFLVMVRTLPAVQAAYCVLHRRPVQGKVAALRAWMAQRPEDALLRDLSRLVEDHFESEAVNHLLIEVLLKERCRQLVDELAGTALATQASPPEQVSQRALLDMHGAVRFSRLRPAHYRGFLEPPTGFDTDFFLVNEIGTLRRSILAPASQAAKALWNGGAPSEHSGTALRTLCRHETEIAALELAGESDQGEFTPSRAADLLARLLPLYPAFHAVLERALECALSEVPGSSGRTPVPG